MVRSIVRVTGLGPELVTKQHLREVVHYAARLDSSAPHLSNTGSSSRVAKGAPRQSHASGPSG